MSTYCFEVPVSAPPCPERQTWVEARRSEENQSKQSVGADLCAPPLGSLPQNGEYSLRDTLAPLTKASRHPRYAWMPTWEGETGSEIYDAL